MFNLNTCFYFFILKQMSALTTLTTLTKFVAKLKAFNKINFDSFDGCYIFFEGNDAYKNKYNKLVIHPVAIEMISLKEDNPNDNPKGNVLITHKTLIDYFKLQPIITGIRQLDNINLTDKSKIYFLKVSFKMKEFKDYQYYPYKILPLLLEKNIKTIRNQEVNKQIKPETEITDNFI